MEKNKFDYHLYWDEWHVRDLEDFVLRDRNHPSVIMWSIGNEIGEQWDTSGIRMARELASIVRNLDPTRPITSGCNFPDPEGLRQARYVSILILPFGRMQRARD